jgi:hypothetical protein
VVHALFDAGVRLWVERSIQNVTNLDQAKLQKTKGHNAAREKKLARKKGGNLYLMDSGELMVSVT